MTNTGNSTPPNTPQEKSDAYRQEVAVKAKAFYDALEAWRPTASELEELEAGGIPESLRVIKEPYLLLVQQWLDGPSPD